MQHTTLVKSLPCLDIGNRHALPVLVVVVVIVVVGQIGVRVLRVLLVSARACHTLTCDTVEAWCPSGGLTTSAALRGQKR